MGVWIGKMYMYDESEYCRRCGTAVYGFSKKLAASDNSYYCVRCAEELDKRYMVRNICSVCNRLLKKQELKFVMPSRMYSSNSIPIGHRLLCGACYKRVARRTRIRSFASINQLRSLVKSVLVRESQK